MPGIVIVGAQWGDEGKGKITDLLAERADVIVRFQGGNNAGHTIVRNGRTWKLHLIPSGILHRGKLCVIGNGVVVDPRILTEELEELRRRRVDTSSLRISANAHLIMPYHLMLDHAGEARLGKLQIGTTRRGIGPCYADKAARLGIRVQDLLDEKILKQKIVAALEPKRLSLRPFAKDPALDLQTMTEEYLVFGHRLEPYIADTIRLVQERLDTGRIVVFEGAQGALLDIDHGTYPFVTSSNPVAGAACVGAGVGPKDIDEVWGVTKAYGTRVGAGPFPTELDGTLAEELRERGGEYGTTTGRPRRIGWLDLVALRYAARINSLTALAITKLDVLSGLDRLQVCTRYRGAEGAEFEYFPYHQTVLHHATGEYEELPGWSKDLSECRSESDLPDAARAYLKFVADSVGVPIALIGVGPGREQVIWTEAGVGMAQWSLSARGEQPRIDGRVDCTGRPTESNHRIIVAEEGLTDVVEAHRLVRRDVLMRAGVPVQRYRWTLGRTMTAAGSRSFSTSREGEVDGVDIGGVTVAAVADSPKVMSDGNWRIGVFIDAQASDEQAEKLGPCSPDAWRPDGGTGPTGRERTGRRACADRGARGWVHHRSGSVRRSTSRSRTWCRSGSKAASRRA